MVSSVHGRCPWLGLLVDHLAYGQQCLWSSDSKISIVYGRCLWHDLPCSILCSVSSVSGPLLLIVSSVYGALSP